MNDTKCKYNLPDPQTTKMKRPNNQGPTAYFSSAGFCNLINYSQNNSCSFRKVYAEEIKMQFNII